MKSASYGARNAVHRGGDVVEVLARVGYAAKGIVYLLLGFLALQAAFGKGSANVNQNSIFQTVLSQPFGKFLLGVVVIGLLAYALWRLIEAVLDPENEGSRKGGLVRRVGYFFSAVIYGALAYTAYQILMGKPGGAGSSGSTQNWTAKLMSMPAGRLLVLLVGLVIIGVGLYAFYSAYKKKFEKQFKWGEMKAEERRNAITLGRVGYAARGVINLIIGIFLVQAALTYNPAKAGGLGEALQTLANQPYGTLILGVVAIGLIAYGLYALLLARYRVIYV